MLVACKKLEIALTGFGKGDFRGYNVCLGIFNQILGADAIHMFDELTELW